ncbi:hypothetical protein GKZ89_09840 [Bacillus mangrovi]|uniref:Uncharacterized protein n=1 Tax=Metabacillus mangrovi TaxID=1491830 RepID=A0A7X2S4X3_9BACI|nr:hypothetical protein [Metabacillus mangrovi]MTH53704.1 hypothetical protein [Metabacillus mangrovi]
MRRKAAILFGILFFLYMGFIVSTMGYPFPSSIVFMVLFTNLLASVAAVFMPKLVLIIYEEMVYHSERGLNRNTGKMFGILFFSINYYVQNILYRLPWYISRPLSLFFFLLLAFEMTGLHALYNY